MGLNAFTSNQGTQTPILTDNTGGVSGTVIAVQKLDISPQGTAGTLWDGKMQGGTINAATVSALPNLPGGSIIVTTGTINAGTINASTVNAGTINTGTVNAGTINTGTINTGTINLGTVVGKDANAAAQTGNPLAIGGTDSGGTIRTIKVDSGGLQRIGLDSGTISVLPNLPQGSINVTAGTVNTGTINTGTINLGTVVGKDANAAAQTGNPLAIGGTDSGGTIRTIKVDSGGLQRIGLDSGTISVLPNLPQGSINVTAGTVNAGTINTGTVNAGTINVATITAGSIVVTAGTFVGNGGSMISYGPAAAAAAAVGNPLNVGGTDSGGTIRTIKVDSGGLQRIGIDSGTISVLPNLPQGSINVTAGTITAGTINAGTVAINPNPTIETNAYGTTTTGTIGTLVAAPSAGSAIFVTSLDVNVQSGTAEPLVSWGLVTNGNQVLSRGNYVAGGGIAKTYVPANSGSATGTALTFNILSGAGTISYNVSYFVAVP